MLGTCDCSERGCLLNILVNGNFSILNLTLFYYLVLMAVYVLCFARGILKSERLVGELPGHEGSVCLRTQAMSM